MCGVTWSTSGPPKSWGLFSAAWVPGYNDGLRVGGLSTVVQPYALVLCETKGTPFLCLPWLELAICGVNHGVSTPTITCTSYIVPVCYAFVVLLSGAAQT